jgi:hypothetical protein
VQLPEAFTIGLNQAVRDAHQRHRATPEGNCMPHQDIKDAASQFWKRPDTDLVSIAETACALGINRNRMNEVPVARRKVGKAWYYCKGEIAAWAGADAQKPNSSLRRLREQSNDSAERTRRRAQRMEPEEAISNFRFSLQLLGCTPDEIALIVDCTEEDQVPRVITKIGRFAEERIRRLLDGKRAKTLLDLDE